MECARDAFGVVAEPVETSTRIFTPLAEAVAEIQRRREHTDLMQRVEDFLQGDIPEYLRSPAPVLYLARHVATPNLETLRFVELARPFGLPMVIGQDTQDKFVAHNAMKYALGKLPLQTDGQIAYRCILDFNAAQGARLCDIRTLAGIPLVEFHNDWLQRVLPAQVQLADDAAWINRQRRGDLSAHYKRFLALFVAHAVMLEAYIDDDAALIRHTLQPAFAFIQRQFGVRPLIANLHDASALPPCDWDAYSQSTCDYLLDFISHDGSATERRQK